MKRNIILRISVVILFTVAILSCDSSSDREPSRIKLLPSRVEYSFSSNIPPNIPYSLISVYSYDNKNRITRIDNTYKTNGEINSIYTTLLEYKDELIIEKRFPVDNPEDITIITYRHSVPKIFMDDEELMKVDKQLRVIEYKGYIYNYDKRGNITSYTYHPWQDERTSTLNLTYDKKNGVFRHVETPSWYITTRLQPNFTLFNNCLTESGVGGSYYKYDMSYNDVDYPTEINRIPVNFLGGASAGTYKISYTEAGI